MHNGQAIAHAHQFRQIAADEKNCLALAGQLAHKAINLRFAADIDAPGWLVEQPNIRVLMKQSAERHLLLIAPAQIANALVGTLEAHVQALSNSPTALRRSASRKNPPRL